MSFLRASSFSQYRLVTSITQLRNLSNMLLALCWLTQSRAARGSLSTPEGEMVTIERIGGFTIATGD
jgi:hypothetical protein